jgi:molybdopterin-containing oxidoreductase family iron-sulfur binding subunit
LPLLGEPDVTSEQKQYWKSLAERNGGEDFTAQAETEFLETPLQTPAQGNRRGFLKAAGFSFAGAVLAGCRAPVTKAVPLLDQPDGVIAGRAQYYATTCSGCPAGCGVLAKSRDGRPIKLEGNPQHPVSRGGLCAIGQASILSVYDSLRFRGPLKDGKPCGWEEMDRELVQRFEAIRKSKGAVRLVSGTMNGPTLRRWTGEFLGSFADARHVVYDPLSCSAILDAHLETHGRRILPRYRFDRADVIVSVDADFLGTWISPVEFTRAYSEARDLERKEHVAYHAQFETRLSLTGSKADRRVALAPGDLSQALAGLARRIAQQAGTRPPENTGQEPAAEELDAIAARLWKARGRSLVVCGLHERPAQVLTNYINHLLGNYGASVDLDRASRQREGNDSELERLLAELDAEKVAALVLLGANPLAELPGDRLERSLRAAPLIVSLGARPDETSSLAHYVCPDHDSLETWGDSEAVNGVVSVFQPLVNPLSATRAAAESLAAWCGRPAPVYELVRETWRKEIHPRSEAQVPFEPFWRQAVHDGFAEVRPLADPVKPFVETAVRAPQSQAADGLALVLYPKAAIGDGRHAYNPWLHELPDPITKSTWDNYACIAPALARKLGVREGDVVRVECDGSSLELPAVVQPGQHPGAIAVALGYGRQASARFAGIAPKWIGARPTLGENGKVGVNAAPLMRLSEGALSYFRSGVRISTTGKRRPVALTQDHHTLSVPRHLDPGGGTRPIVQETTVTEALAHPEHAPDPPRRDLWPLDHPYDGRRWTMVVDLNACTGCSACVAACQVENNIPVAGKDEVLRNREMHWLRIDRYYSGPEENPDVAYQPMMCQQCEHAPCETVCPVLATVHSSEGLNQQVYNRCVGTRYCANNCPYKARRFNWFDYARDDRLANMVLNPDVTVRSRGVMEKCTFCVQRIQEAKIESKASGKPVQDGDIQTACQQSCPARAIEFGDVNDPNSRVARLMRSGRRYRALEELNVRPRVSYLKVARNRPETKQGEHHG